MSKSSRDDARGGVVNIRNYFKQYCTSTSIHGFQYFGEDRSVFEKIWWVFVFVIILSGCSFMIYKIYEKYDSTPVIVSFATKETPIYKIPFPAITICPETKSDRVKFNYTKVTYKRANDEFISPRENESLQYMSLLCENHFEFKWDNKTLISDDFFDTLDEIKPEFLTNFNECKFWGMKVNCSEIFVPVFTDEGVCYSFNMLDRDHIYSDIVKHYKDYHKVDEDKSAWDMETGYSESANINAYPNRALHAGATNGLFVEFLTWNENLDYMCNGVQGYKVILHSPVRVPKLKKEYFRVPLDQSVVVTVQPSMITTSEAVKSYDASKRDCYFPSERKLKYFRSYSQQNCQLECLTNTTLEICECVNIFMPRANNTTICGSASYQCMKAAELMVNTLELALKFPNSPGFSDPESKEYLEEVKSEGTDCDCMPLCTDLSYNMATSQTDWNWEEQLRVLKLGDIDKDFIHLSSLTVYFKVNHFITSERQELYGPIDFVANFGGLLGLFTGFSILSFMEIIYFLTVRICCNIRLYGRWTGTVSQ